MVQLYWIPGRGGNRFYKGHRDIAEIASIPPKTYFKSLAVLEKDKFSLKSLQK
jgi:hypothetical protein